MTTLVFGPNGYLGSCFLNSLPDSVPSRVDIANASELAGELDRYQPDVVINCAGKTGCPNVDWCEAHKAETLRSNVTGPLVLVDECRARNIYMVHISSGCLYRGDNHGRGFTEEDPPNYFGSYYVRTKYYVEQLLAEFPILIVRPRMLFDGSLNQRNLIIKLSKYRRLLRELNSLTYVPDLLIAVRHLIDQRATGIFHIVNPGTISPFEIMERFSNTVDSSLSFDELPVGRLSEVAVTGRSNCVLSVQKLLQHGLELQPVSSAVDESLRSIRTKM